MLSNLFKRIHKHDWEILARVALHGKIYKRKICLKCGKFIDEIKKSEERQEKAKEINTRRIFKHYNCRCVSVWKIPNDSRISHE